MAEKIRIGIAGFGNLGRGAELAVAKNGDMTLVGVFTRRAPASVTPADSSVPVHHYDDLAQHTEDIDVLLACGGSKTDLPEQVPHLAGLFNTVDSFDTHAKIPEYFDSVDGPARRAGKTAIISTGWDPGLFSLNRVYGEALVPDGETYTFWGRGVSQGHSDAVRRVDGVAAAVQYTIPAEDAIEAVRRGDQPSLTTRDKHRRECFVVLAEGADPEAVREAIVTMPHYFEPYETIVHFVEADEFAREHSAMPHGGFVLRSGATSPDARQLVEYKLALESNPQFTSSVLVAYARAAHRLAKQGQYGAKTVFDVPVGLISPRSPEQLRADML